MDSHTISALGRLDVVEAGRRRRWSEDEKIRIVLESMAGPRLISTTARRYNISRSLLISWRRAFKLERSSLASPPEFVPAVIAMEPSQTATKASIASRSGEGRIEIILPHGRRLKVDAGVDAAALSRVLDVLERR
jgi:transposase